MSEMTKEERLEAFVDAVKRGAIVYAAPDVMASLTEWSEQTGVDISRLDIRIAHAVPPGYLMAFNPRMVPKYLVPGQP